MAAVVTGTAALLFVAGSVAVLANEGGLNGQRSQQAPAAAGPVSAGLGTRAAATSSPQPAPAASPPSGRRPAPSTARCWPT